MSDPGVEQSKLSKHLPPKSPTAWGDGDRNGGTVSVAGLLFCHASTCSLDLDQRAQLVTRPPH